MFHLGAGAAALSNEGATPHVAWPARTIHRMPLTFAQRRRRRWPWIVAAVVVVGALGTGGAIVISHRDTGPPPLPDNEVASFLRAWTAGDAVLMARWLDAPPADLETLALSVTRAVPGTRAVYTRTGVLLRTGLTVSATYHARVDIAGNGPVEWDGNLTLVRIAVGKQQVWRVRWEPDVLYPGLGVGQRLTVRMVWPARSTIFANDGSVLAGNAPIVTIGLEPDRVGPSLAQAKKLLQTLVGTDPALVDAALHAPGVRPNYFVPVATVPDDARYATVIRPQLYPLPGVLFRRTHGVLATSSTLGTQMIGRVGEITAERLKQLGSPYRVGDQVGLSGLQGVYETRLAGSPSATVAIVSGSKVVHTVKRFPGRAPQPVKLTIDPHTQQAAEAALVGVTQNAALVAIDVPTGQLRAVVSKPDGGFNRALDGAYPPGSTFKVITTTMLLETGRTATTPAPCPPVITVDGRPFKNFEGEASGTLDLAHAFAISCNNAFIGLADQEPAGALGKTAATFGFGVPWSLPVPSYGGSYPTPRDRAELAASAIGQGRVLASPAQMAAVAAAVASGAWHAPVLTTLPAPKVPPTGVPPDPAALATLRSFMAAVVQPGGTAAGAGLPPNTFGKTGTAEFGPKNPPDTHAWFIGYHGNVAFALIVEGGGVGGRVAAPLAARFLAAL